MVGAAIGMMRGGSSSLVSGTLLSAGMSGFGSFEYGKTTDWNKWGTSTAIGAATGFVSGFSAMNVSATMTAKGFSHGMVTIASSTISALRGNITAQNMQVAFGMRDQHSLMELGFAGLGGAAGGAISAGLSRGLFHDAAGRILKCSVSETNFVARHVIGGILGGGIGDVLNQTGAYLTEGKEFEWGSLATSMALGAVTGHAGAKAQHAGLLKACFSGDTKLRVRDLFGERWKRFDELLVNDEVLSRDEYNVNGPVDWKRVEEIFARTGRIAHLHAGGQLIPTTGEHPFFVVGKGWLPAQELAIGDLLVGHDGKLIPVEELYDTGEFGTVFNCRVANWHTYFIGDDDWAFDVWAHNTYSDESAKGGPTSEQKQKRVEELLVSKGMSRAEAKRVAADGARLTENERKTARANGSLTQHEGDLLLYIAEKLVISDPNAAIKRDPKWQQPDNVATPDTHGTDATGHNSRELRKALGLTQGDGTAAHHLAESTAEFHLVLRDLLTDYQIPINSDMNGVPVVDNKISGLPHVPRGEESVSYVPRFHRNTQLHTTKGEFQGARQAADRLKNTVAMAESNGASWHQRRAALIHEMNQLKLEIVAGTFPQQLQGS